MRMPPIRPTSVTKQHDISSNKIRVNGTGSAAALSMVSSFIELCTHKGMDKEARIFREHISAYCPEETPSSDGGLKILGRGVIAVLVMLALSLLFMQISPILSTAALLLTVTVVLVFTYAYWVETQKAALNPVVLFYSILLTTALAVLVLASLLIV